MAITGNSYTVAEINRAMGHVEKVIGKLPEGSANAALIQFLLELYLGSLDNSKEDNKQAMSAGN